MSPTIRKALPVAILLGGLVACQNSTEQKSQKDATQYTDPVPVVLSSPQELEEVTVSAARVMPAYAEAERKRVMYNSMMPAKPMPEIPPSIIEQNSENYRGPADNPIRLVSEQPLSTFSVDVDTASYANIRRMILQDGNLPPQEAVRVEEMINYFHYDYPKPSSKDQPFNINTELSTSPWNNNKYLMRIGLQAYEPDMQQRPAANLVFLVDVSGSMRSKNKLPLLKKSLLMLLDNLEAQDKVSLVVYAGAAGLVLPATAASEKAKIRAAINGLEAGGSTHGSAGIKLAYEQAQQAFIEGGINRVLIASDGDMNVGVTDIDQLKTLIERKRKSGIALTTLGFGTGNYNDALMEELADVGNGNAAYIDSLKEAYKVLVHQMNATLHTIASDVKIQVEFNPDQVSEYRLVGYENRILNREDFNNDKVDAGDIGMGHQVTAIYELSLKGEGSLPELRYGKAGFKDASRSGLSKTRPRLERSEELAYIKLRYKAKQGDASRLSEKIVNTDQLAIPFKQASNEHRFAVSVAELGQRLRGGKNLSEGNMQELITQLRNSKGLDKFSYRGELINIAEIAASIDQQIALQ
ncbi:VWA domain-containing protein [uncultured Pseudoteredinibacter sp.]|uniref:vWA domain-containing protein n=1 Tax=uncultured Pseudoteredinibacter sp. TaxID=1641701 RepID=UPI00262637FF|nr:VWA domain-containing protein [uncultured Pseudoteredinibacter sp.]